VATLVGPLRGVHASFRAGQRRLAEGLLKLVKQAFDAEARPRWNEELRLIRPRRWENVSVAPRAEVGRVPSGAPFEPDVKLGPESRAPLSGDGPSWFGSIPFGRVLLLRDSAAPRRREDDDREQQES